MNYEETSQTMEPVENNERQSRPAPNISTMRKYYGLAILTTALSSAITTGAYKMGTLNAPPQPHQEPLDPTSLRQSPNENGDQNLLSHEFALYLNGYFQKYPFSSKKMDTVTPGQKRSLRESLIAIFHLQKDYPGITPDNMEINQIQPNFPGAINKDNKVTITYADKGKKNVIILDLPTGKVENKKSFTPPPEQSPSPKISHSP